MRDPRYELYEAVRSLIAAVPVLVPTDPDPPYAAGIDSWTEVDLVPVLRAYERCVRAGVELPAQWVALGAWIYDHQRHTMVGHGLCRDIGVELGQLREDDPFDDAPTDPLSQVLFRAQWEPNVDADADAQRAELATGIRILHELFGRDEFAGLLSGPGLVLDLSELSPPLTLEDDGLDLELEPVPSTATAASAAAPVSELASPRPRVGRWGLGAIAAAGTFAGIVALCIPELTHAPATAEPPPLPMAEFRDVELTTRTCPLPIPTPIEPSAIELAAAAAIPPPPPQRKASPVKLTNTGGVIVRSPGQRDQLVQVRVLKPNERPPSDAHVIDVERHGGTAIQMSLAGKNTLSVEMRK